MLCLTRKLNQAICLFRDGIEIARIRVIDGGTVKLGIDCLDTITVLREEIAPVGPPSGTGTQNEQRTNRPTTTRQGRHR